MRREQSAFLVKWLNSSTRKPLVIRGARQVGKTWIIRDLAQSEQRDLIELNFERRPDLESLFSSNDPQEIVRHIETWGRKKVNPSKCILFLDEIQSAPHILAKLRWFAEEMPELAVVAAGSLLDFALATYEFSMPVGRISYFYLEPLSFEEFLDAIGEGGLLSYLQNYQLGELIPEAIHSKLMGYIKEYLIVGGMPAAVTAWKDEKTLEIVNQIHFDLLTTYRDDFAKYSGRLKIDRLEEVLSSIPHQLGKKFVYKHVNPEIVSSSLKQALDLLTKARICYRICSTASNGLPLGAEVDEKFVKVILLDCGLCNVVLGISLHQLNAISEIAFVNNGAMAEQLVGQLLYALTPGYIPPALYYWQRGKKGSEAEVDYIIQHENQVIPIEVKGGTTGTLKSLHQFMKEKKKKIAVRINSDFPTLLPIQVKDSLGTSNIEYTLLSLPFYLVGQLHRLINSIRR